MGWPCAALAVALVACQAPAGRGDLPERASAGGEPSAASARHIPIAQPGDGRLPPEWELTTADLASVRGAREAIMAWVLELRDGGGQSAPTVDAEPPEGCHLERHIVSFDGEVILDDFACVGQCPGGGACAKVLRPSPDTEHGSWVRVRCACQEARAEGADACVTEAARGAMGLRMFICKGTCPGGGHCVQGRKTLDLGSTHIERRFCVCVP
ncbi:MAG: hypothetical protein HY722_09120 [Planctomycetes bacterium]|nr:hypothetical protein [Planctomycetota bacterium]